MSRNFYQRIKKSILYISIFALVASPLSYITQSAPVSAITSDQSTYFNALKEACSKYFSGDTLIVCIENGGIKSNGTTTLGENPMTDPGASTSCKNPAGSAKEACNVGSNFAKTQADLFQKAVKSQTTTPVRSTVNSIPNNKPANDYLAGAMQGCSNYANRVDLLAVCLGAAGINHYANSTVLNTDAPIAKAMTSTQCSAGSILVAPYLKDMTAADVEGACQAGVSWVNGNQDSYNAAARSSGVTDTTPVALINPQYRNDVLKICSKYINNEEAMSCLYGGLGKDGKEGLPKSIDNCRASAELIGSSGQREKNIQACIYGGTEAKKSLYYADELKAVASSIQKATTNDKVARTEYSSYMEALNASFGNLIGSPDTQKIIGGVVANVLTGQPPFSNTNTSNPAPIPKANSDMADHYKDAFGNNQPLNPVLSGQNNSPAIILVHGGGFRTDGGTYGPDFQERARQAGYTTFRIKYPLVSNGIYTQYNSIRNAVQYVIDHADQYKIDKKRIGIMGDSAGAALSARVATSGTSGVAAAATWSTPTNAFLDMFNSFEAFVDGIDHSTCVDTSMFDPIVNGAISLKNDADLFQKVAAMQPLSPTDMSRLTKSGLQALQLAGQFPSALNAFSEKNLGVGVEVTPLINGQDATEFLTWNPPQQDKVDIEQLAESVSKLTDSQSDQLVTMIARSKQFTQPMIDQLPSQEQQQIIMAQYVSSKLLSAKMLADAGKNQDPKDAVVSLKSVKVTEQERAAALRALPQASLSPQAIEIVKKAISEYKLQDANNARTARAVINSSALSKEEKTAALAYFNNNFLATTQDAKDIASKPGIKSATIKTSFYSTPNPHLLSAQGIQECMQNFYDMSPSISASPQSPPHYLTTFAIDYLVWARDAYLLQNRLQSLGVRSEVLEFPGKGHMGYDPRAEEGSYKFLNSALRPKPGGVGTAASYNNLSTADKNWTDCYVNAKDEGALNRCAEQFKPSFVNADLAPFDQTYRDLFNCTVHGISCPKPITASQVYEGLGKIPYDGGGSGALTPGLYQSALDSIQQFTLPRS